MFHRIGPPVLFSIPSDKSIVEGDIVTFRCIALGDPFPSVEWIFNDTVLSNGDKYQIESSGSDFGLLRIMDTTFSDRGAYTCRFNNTIGTASTTVHLNVQGMCVLWRVIVDSWFFSEASVCWNICS